MRCNLLIGEEMALKVLKNEAAREKYRQFLFNDEVKVCTFLILERPLTVIQWSSELWTVMPRVGFTR